MDGIDYLALLLNQEEKSPANPSGLRGVPCAGYYSPEAIEALDKIANPKPFSVFEQLYEDVDPKMIGEGGAPTRATILPEKADERKKFPVASGVLDYFPDALAAISYLSQKGNDQHNPGQSLRWARGKSSDEADTMMRHFLQRGTIDTDGVPHSVKMAWRALAILQKELEEKTQ